MNDLEQVLDDLKNKRIRPSSKNANLITVRPRNDNSFKKLLKESLENSDRNITEIVEEVSSNNFNTPFIYIDNVREMNRVLEPYKVCKSVAVSLIAFDEKGNLSTDPFFAKPSYLALAFTETQAIILNLSKISLSISNLSSLFSSRVLKVVFNAHEFLIFARHLGLEVNAISDMRILDQLLCKGLGNLSPTLDETVKKRLGYDIVFPVLRQDSSILEINKVLATQTVLQLELARVLYPLIRDEGMQKLAALENQCTLAITDMIYNGMPFDIPLFTEMKRERTEEVQQISQELQKALSYNLNSLFGEIPRTVNLDSPSHIQKAFARIGIELPNTSEETLLPLSEKYQEIKLLLGYRKKSYALHHTLSDSFLNHIHPLTKRIHAHAEQIGTSTGRIIISKPNLQGIMNGEPRKVFRDADGYSFVTGDYKQIDVVAMAVIAQDEVMLNEISRGEDIYVAAGKTFLQKESITSAERKKSKPVVLGLIYNMSDQRLCLEAKSMGSELSLTEAATFRSLFFGKYQGIKNLHDRLKEETKQTHQVTSLMNRVRAFDNCLVMIDKPESITHHDLKKLIDSALHVELLRHNKGAVIKANSMKEAKEFASILTELDLTFNIVPDVPPLGEVYNGPAQMSVADLIKTDMVSMLKYMPRFDAKFVMTKHDDLSYIVPNKHVEEFSGVLKKVMEESSIKVFKGIRAVVEIKVNIDFS